MRLGPPLAQTAFFLPATVQLVDVSLDEAGGGALHEGKPVHCIDPAVLVRGVENEMRNDG